MLLKALYRTEALFDMCTQFSIFMKINNLKLMGIIKDLKNIFFGASAVTKSATDKAGEFIKEEGDVLFDKAKDIATNSAETLADKTAGLKDSILENSGDLMAKTKEKLIDIGDDISDNPLTDKVKTSGEKFMDKAGEISENVGEVVLEKGGVLLDKSKDLSEDVGSKVLEAKDKFMDKASEVKDQMSEKLEDTMEKADAWAAEEKANPKPEFAEDTIDASGSLLEGTDDFFAKADKFSSGDYGAFSEGKVSVIDGAEEVKKPKEFDKLPPATGFDDLDGDGNEIIDDAIIEE